MNKIKKLSGFLFSLILTICLVYWHFNSKKNYESKLEGFRKLSEGQGIKARINLDEKYAVMTHKKKQGTFINYTFDVNGSEFKGTIMSLDKTIYEVIKDSVYYLSENPNINSVIPDEDYHKLKDEGIWNWRLYLSFLTGLAAIGSLMKDKEKVKE